MTRVKICGITRLEDALCAVEAGADALGFVFAESPRRVTPQQVRAIRREVPTLVRSVGVFVNAPREEVDSVADEAELDILQLHGEETPLYCRQFHRPVLKRFTVTDDDTPEGLRAKLEEYDVAGYLLDPGAGSGRAFRWEIARSLGVRLILAGGLTADNVAAAVSCVRPHAVDVSSGVEESPGIKNADKIRAFIAALRQQDARTQPA